jgi:hypothetical protein
MWYLLGYLPMKLKKKKESEFIMEKVFGRVLELGWLSGVEIDNRRFSWQLSKIYIYIYIAMALFSFHVFLI